MFRRLGNQGSLKRTSDAGTLGLRIFDPGHILEVNIRARPEASFDKGWKSKDFLGCQRGVRGTGTGGGPRGRGHGVPEPGGSRELQGGSEAPLAACKPLLALLCADSPSLSHLFPFLSPPTCLPPSAHWQAAPLIPLTSLGLLAALKWGGSLYLGWRNLRYLGARNHGNGLAEGELQAPPHRTPSSQPAPPLPCLGPPTSPLQSQPGGVEGRKGYQVGEREEEKWG